MDDMDQPGQPAATSLEPGKLPVHPWEYSLRKYLLLLAALVVTVTYAAGFSPPGGVWQAAHDGQPAGDPIIRGTHYHRYLAFYYCNATAFAASLVVIVLILVLAIRHDKGKDSRWVVVPLRLVMLLDLLSLMGAYGTGTCRDKISTIYYAALVAAVFLYVALLKLVDWCCPDNSSGPSTGGTMIVPNCSNGSGSSGTMPTTDLDSGPGSDGTMIVPNCSNGSGSSGTMPTTDLDSGPGSDGTMIVPNCSNGSGSSGTMPTTDLDSGPGSDGTMIVPNCSNGSGSSGTMPTTDLDSGPGSDGTITVPMPTTNLDSGVDAIPAPVPNSDPEVNAQEKQARNKLKAKERLCKVLMLLATFAVSITYVAGLSTPGGFWDTTGGSHHPGDAILRDQHGLRLTVFLLCNTTAFVASLFITMLLIIDGKKLRKKTARSCVLYGCIVVALVGLVGAYAAGSCRETDTTIYVVSLVGAVLAYILLHGFCSSASKLFSCCFSQAEQPDEHNVSPAQQTDENASDKEALDKARSLVLLLATLATTVTYAAGLDPPGGLWQDNSDGHTAGDPILLTNNIRRYRAFYYCNSVAFVASLVAIVLVQKEKLVKHHALEAAMILDLFGLIGAYAARSCRDVNKSIYSMALAGAVLIYVVIHIVFFTLDHKDKKDNDQEDQLLEKRRKRLLLFAILAVTITYQAGLTPPGGFLLQDDKIGRHHAGDPVLLHNYPRRYNVFFYCNSISFMLSIALIILLVNPNLYRPAIRSNALSVCTAVGLFCLMGAYAAGSTQHLKTSIYTLVLVAVVILVAVGLLLVFLKRNGNSEASSVPIKHKDEEEERKKHTRRKYLMLLGILVASVAYQAGLEPPGGAWQSSINGYEAGNPVMYDNRRPRYLIFFYSNSISFVASIVVIIMLLPQWLPKKEEGEWEKWTLKVMNWTIRLDLFALLVAYAAGSNREWKTSVYVVLLIIAVLGYFAIHMKISTWSERRRERPQSFHGNPPA